MQGDEDLVGVYLKALECTGERWCLQNRQIKWLCGEIFQKVWLKINQRSEEKVFLVLGRCVLAGTLEDWAGIINISKL